MCFCHTLVDGTTSATVGTPVHECGGATWMTTSPGPTTWHRCSTRRRSSNSPRPTSRLRDRIASAVCPSTPCSSTICSGPCRPPVAEHIGRAADDAWPAGRRGRRAANFGSLRQAARRSGPTTRCDPSPGPSVSSPRTSLNYERPPRSPDDPPRLTSGRPAPPPRDLNRHRPDGSPVARTGGACTSSHRVRDGPAPRPEKAETTEHPVGRPHPDASAARCVRRTRQITDFRP